MQCFFIFWQLQHSLSFFFGVCLKVLFFYVLFFQWFGLWYMKKKNASSMFCPYSKFSCLLNLFLLLFHSLVCSNFCLLLMPFPYCSYLYFFLLFLYIYICFCYFSVSIPCMPLFIFAFLSLFLLFTFLSFLFLFLLLFPILLLLLFVFLFSLFFLFLFLSLFHSIHSIYAPMYKPSFTRVPVSVRFLFWILLLFLFPIPVSVPFLPFLHFLFFRSFSWILFLSKLMFLSLFSILG